MPSSAHVVTAAVSTVGDYLWANVLPHGQPVYWFAHAIVLFLTIGACLGLPSRRPLAGAVGAVSIGCLATAGFWILRPIAGYAGSMFLLFTLLWIALGVLTGRVLQRRDNIGMVLVRSALAAVGSGLGVLRDLRDLDAVQSARLGLRAAFHLLDDRISACVRGAPRLRRTGA